MSSQQSLKAKRRRARSRAGMKVTTIALDSAIHERLRIIAVREHTVLTELVRTAVREWLDRRGKHR
jgi:predicted transcriptional regulator